MQELMNETQEKVCTNSLQIILQFDLVVDLFNSRFCYVQCNCSKVLGYQLGAKIIQYLDKTT